MEWSLDGHIFQPGYPKNELWRFQGPEPGTDRRMRMNRSSEQTLRESGDRRGRKPPGPAKPGTATSSGRRFKTAAGAILCSAPAVHAGSESDPGACKLRSRPSDALEQKIGVEGQIRAPRGGGRQTDGHLRAHRNIKMAEILQNKQKLQERRGRV